MKMDTHWKLLIENWFSPSTSLSESTIKRVVERFYRTGLMEDQRAGKFCSSGRSLVNIGSVRASVAEQYTMFLG